MAEHTDHRTRRTGITRVALVITVATAVMATTFVGSTSAAGARPAGADWTPPDGALPDTTSALYVVEEPVGTRPGATSTETNERADFEVFAQDRRIVVDVRGDVDTNLMFGVPDGPGLVPAHFAYTEDSESSLTLIHDGRGCNQGDGWVDVTRADFAAGQLAHLELTFAHSCSFNGGPAQYHGALVWDASAPPPTPNPVAIPDDLWAPAPGQLPADANAAYVETPIAVIDGLTATGTGVTGHDDDLDPNDAWGDAWRFAFGSGDASLHGTIRAGRHDDPLRVGLYDDVYGNNVNGVTGELDLSYGSNAMSSCKSWFAVDELSRSNGRIDHIAFRFEHDCSPLGLVTRGAVRWSAKPAITSITPNQGISRGGTEIQVEGIDLVDISRVTVGGVDATIVRSSWGSFLGFRTPTVPVGSHEVRITAAGGEAVGTGATGFTATPDTPAAPASVTVTPGAARALVEWEPPADLGAGTITGVRLDLFQSSNQDGAPPNRTMTVGPVDTAALWGELTPGYQYRVAVTYLSTFGPGETWDRKHSYHRIPEVDVVPFDGMPTLVTQQYVDFVGRGPTTAERNAAVAEIRSGKKLPEAYVASMRNRPEWGGVRAPVTRLYAAYFGRLPDASGLAYWAKKLRSGTTLARASATFAASSEFKRKYGSLSNGAFVDLVYRNVLHRTADASGRTHWIRKLNAGASRGAVMTSFSESSEHVRTMAPTVDAVLLYTGMLRRMPTASELPGGAASDLRAAPGADAPDPVALAEPLRRSPAYAARF